MAPDAASSSSSAQSSPKKYDAFISFRGEDTRSNFTSHLHDALCRKHLETYVDYKLPKGDEISPALKLAIEESNVSVVIFSENYASSRWCLDELTHIIHCKRVQEQVFIPVFYKVEPCHVRNQTGPYKQAFEKHERDLEHNPDKMQMWKHALTEAANFAGWDSLTFRDESELVQKIVKDVLRKLNHRYASTELKGLVNIDDYCAQIELLLREVQTIGIWGMGGIGKTTIARAIFVKSSSHYEGCCFLANIRENSGKLNGVDDLRHKLFSGLLEEEDPFIHTSTTLVEYRLSRKTVLIVLDDVSTLEQIEYLIGELRCFGLGSKIIITTRDKHVLSKGVDKIYEVKGLKFQESLRLFSLNAFNQNLPIMGYEELSERAVVYAKGVPLALKVLGSFLRGKRENEWNSALRKLENIPHEDIQRVLRLSYDGLNHEEKNIFLDIACFLKGALKEHVISFLDSCGFYGAIGLRTLHDKALINANDYTSIEMHDLIQEMGWEIVREESINEPERRSRLWDYEEIYDVLDNNKGTNKIEGIMLDVPGSKGVHLSAQTFKQMPNLRFLKFHRHVHLPKGLKFLPNKIRYLEWYAYPLKSLPSTFCAEKLVELRMPNSGVQKLWHGVQNLVNLKYINLKGSKQLMELPDFSKALDLKEVRLEFCESLRYVHPSILSLHSLAVLALYGCKKLKSLRSEIHLKSLKYINVEECLNLKEFSLSSEKIRELDLSGTGIQILYSSVVHSINLDELDLSGLRLKSLPNQLSCLRNLTVLSLCNCDVIDNSKLHIFFDGMLCLREIYLNNCSNITELPNNTEHLIGLECLSLSGCKRLCSLPKLPPSIATLVADDCMSLETVSTCRLLNRCGKYINFGNCVNLNEQSLHSIIEDAHFTIIGAAYGYELARKAQHKFNYDSNYIGSSILFPGSRVPEWFRCQTTHSSVIIEIPQNSHLMGFAFCTVLHSKESISNAALKCACYTRDSKVFGFEWSRFIPVMNSDHVCIWNCNFSGKMLKKIEKLRNHQLVTSLMLSFEFKVEPLLCIKEYGLCPIYVSDCQEFFPQWEFERKSKRPLRLSGC